MMKLNSSARFNRRYLMIEGSQGEIEKAIMDYIGVLGWAKASPIFVGKSGEKQILAINREEIANVRAAFEFSSAKISVMRVSGTLKGLGKI